MSAVVAGSEEWPLQVSAEHHWVTFSECRDDLETSLQIAHRSGDQREHGPRCAVRAMQGEGSGDGIGAVIKSVSTTAMTMNINKSGGKPRAGGIDDCRLRRVSRARRVTGGRQPGESACAGRYDHAAVEDHPAVFCDSS